MIVMSAVMPTSAIDERYICMKYIIVNMRALSAAVNEMKLIAFCIVTLYHQTIF